MKKTISLILSIVLTASLLATTAFADGGLSNFQKTLTYKEGKFADVSSSDWYNTNVKAAYEYGLMNGKTASAFGASDYVTIAETITMAARLNSIYTTGKADFAASTPWYQTYVDYAIANGIISKGRFENYEINATRFQVVEIFAAAMPSSAFAAINTINIGAIPDVSLETNYNSIYTLYRAGILTGKTSAGEFYPSEKVLRSEIAAIVTRMADASLRVKFTITPASDDSAEVVNIASGTELLAAVKKGFENASLASGYYSDGYQYALLSSTTNTQLNLAASKKCVLAAAAYAKATAAYCKNNSAFSSMYDSLNNSYTNLTKAAANIDVIYAAPYANSWTATKTLIADSANALNSASVAIDTIV
ncbi:MAG: S-layer homology domain-containing protein [Oscillospiraceae bacterium]|nr:S-layer homology domain-containing protein [Oscillospiraceae bacterium]